MDSPHCAGKEAKFEPFLLRSETLAQRGLRLELAMADCKGCPLKEACLDTGIHTDLPRGVWGGTVLTRLDQKRKKRRRTSGSA